MNGTNVASGDSLRPNNIIRTRNYIVKSNWKNNDLAKAFIKNLRIYNRALSKSGYLIK